MCTNMPLPQVFHLEAPVYQKSGLRGYFNVTLQETDQMAQRKSMKKQQQEEEEEEGVDAEGFQEFVNRARYDLCVLLPK